jgi:hypothetical protein
MAQGRIAQIGLECDPGFSEMPLTSDFANADASVRFC